MRYRLKRVAKWISLLGESARSQNRRVERELDPWKRARNATLIFIMRRYTVQHYSPGARASRCPSIARLLVSPIRVCRQSWLRLRRRGAWLGGEARLGRHARGDIGGNNAGGNIAFCLFAIRSAFAALIRKTNPRCVRFAHFCTGKACSQDGIYDAVRFVKFQFQLLGVGRYQHRERKLVGLRSGKRLKRCAVRGLGCEGFGCRGVTSVTGQPACASARAHTQPSPPLLPLPQSTTTGAGRESWACASSAIALPARSISSASEVPPAAIACSSFATSATSKTGRCSKPESFSKSSWIICRFLSSC